MPISLKALTVKSDDVAGRSAASMAVLKGDALIRESPEAAWRVQLVLKAAASDVALYRWLKETAHVQQVSTEPVTVSFASSHTIRSWSYGEVKTPETIDWRTRRMEKDGLFCERIFGPVKDWECACGKYRGMEHKGVVCDRCRVKIMHGRERCERMGHIDLAVPVLHPWSFKAIPSQLGTLLDMDTASLEEVAYFHAYVVTNPGGTPLKMQQLLTEEAYRAARRQYPDGGWEAGMGAEAIYKLLIGLDLAKLSVDLRAQLLETNSIEKKNDLIHRLKIIEAFATGISGASGWCSTPFP